jgi:hypothetical protein
VGKLEDIAERNERALRDTRNKLVWVSVIVLGLIGVAVALAVGLGVPKTPFHPASRAHDGDRANGVLLRSAP